MTAVVSKINVASCSTLLPGCLATAQPGAWNAPTSCLLYAVPLQSCDSTEGRIMITCPFLASVRFHPHLTANADRSTVTGVLTSLVARYLGGIPVRADRRSVGCGQTGCM